MFNIPNIKKIQQADITSPKISSQTVRCITNVHNIYEDYFFSLNYCDTHENKNDIVQFIWNKFMCFKNTNFTD